MNDLVTIAARADNLQLPFLLAGGHAVIVHGYARSTFDLDLMVRQEDRARWLELIQGLGYSLLREGPTFLQFNAPARSSFPLDLMLVNATTFSRMQADAVATPALAGGVRVVSLMHLLALKCHAVKHGHPGRIVKDADDVIHLLQNNGMDPDAEAVREVFRNHGSEEFYEKIRKASRRT